MNTDLNLLFVVMALQSGLINSDQFVEACTLWTTRRGTPLADLLLERRWIKSADVSHIQYLVDRRVDKHGGDPQLSLAGIDNDVKRQLASINDAEIQRSLGHLPASVGSANSAVTIDVPPEKRERYALTRLHAIGGGGRVWLAHDTQLDRDVAFKELRPEVAGDGALWARFQREARVTGQLEHPGIVPVYDYGRQSTQEPFYTMRFVKGRTLAEAARDYHQNRLSGQAGSLELISLLNAFTTVCNTIAYAHSRGVIHRDLKGQNVVLGDFGEVVVLDWGLAKLVNEPEPDQQHEPVPAQNAAHFNLTMQGETVGTPGYMAPEQAAGRPDLIDCRTDIYGLGAILYEILTGHPPFTGSDTKEVIRRVLEEEPAAPSRTWPEVPQTLEAICLKAMSKKAIDRYGHATDLSDEVQLWQDLERRKAQEVLDRFFNLSVDMLCVGGLDGYFKHLNPAWEPTLGYTNAEMLSHPWLYFVHPDDQEATIAAAGELLAGRNVVGFTNRYRCKDGSYKWMAWTSMADLEDKLIYATVRDVTQQRQSEEDLRESEMRYRSVVAALEEGIVVFDANSTIQACNSSAERILGLTTDELINRTSADPRWLTIREDGSPFPHDAYPVTITLRTGQPCTNVVMGIHKPDGTLNWISINSQPLIRTDGSTMYGVLASFADVTELKRKEDLLKQTSKELEEARLELARLKHARGAS